MHGQVSCYNTQAPQTCRSLRWEQSTTCSFELILYSVFQAVSPVFPLFGLDPSSLARSTLLVPASEIGKPVKWFILSRPRLTRLRCFQLERDKGSIFPLSSSIRPDPVIFSHQFSLASCPFLLSGSVVRLCTWWWFHETVLPPALIISSGTVENKYSHDLIASLISPLSLREKLQVGCKQDALPPCF